MVSNFLKTRRLTKSIGGYYGVPKRVSPKNIFDKHSININMVDVTYANKRYEAPIVVENESKELSMTDTDETLDDDDDDDADLYPKAYGADFIDDSVNYINEEVEHLNPSTEVWVLNYKDFEFNTILYTLIAVGWEVVARTCVDIENFNNRTNKKKNWVYKGTHSQNILRSNNIDVGWSSHIFNKALVYASEINSIRFRYDYKLKSLFKWTYTFELILWEQWRIFVRVLIGSEKTWKYPEQPAVWHTNLVDDMGAHGNIKFDLWQDIGLEESGAYAKYARELKVGTPVTVMPMDYWIRRRYNKPTTRRDKDLCLFTDDER
jgi:hypothetical protein